LDNDLSIDAGWIPTCLEINLPPCPAIDADSTARSFSQKCTRQPQRDRANWSFHLTKERQKETSSMLLFLRFTK
jgi:hypothetical protein